MCGLFGVVLPRQYPSAVPVGFLDAAGLATCDGTGAWTVRRTLGPFRRLPRSSSGPRGANALAVAIGHTRWATQGGRTLAQASPIAAGSLLCMHNGTLDPASPA